MLRKLKWYAIGLVALITVILLVLLVRLDAIVRRQIVVQSAAALKVPTSLAAAHVSIMSESIGLRDFEVTSPRGFAAPAMLSLDEVHTDVNVAHLRANPLTVDRLVLTRPKLTIEQSGGKLNVQALTDQPGKTPDDGSEPMQLIVKELTIKNAQVILRPGIPGLDQELPITIPTFTVKDIGTAAGNQNGVALKQVLLLIVNDLAKSASNSPQVPEQVRALLKLNVRDVIDQQVGKIREKADQELGKQLDKILPGVGNTTRH